MKIRLLATPKLKEIRSKYGSQAEFVDLLSIYHPEININTYAKQEQGNRTISVSQAKTIADSLNMTMAELFINPNYDPSAALDDLDHLKEMKGEESV